MAFPRHEISTFLRESVSSINLLAIQEGRVGFKRLPLALALILGIGLAALHELDVPVRCAAPASLQASKLAALNRAAIGSSHTPLSYTLEERDYLIRTMAFEAPGEPDMGKAAVAHVILNRKNSHGWGDTVKDVVMKPWQFEPWMTKRRDMEKLSPDDPRYRRAGRIADAVLAGDVPDPTAGATHFLNPTVVRQRRGGSLPSWARGDKVSIGRHTFYSSDEDYTGQRWAGLSFDGMLSAIFPSRPPASC
jgi:hypothetical protein